jgi:hypothetical protein
VARGLTLDTGALIAAEHRSVFAQAWRGRNPLIDRLLPACVLEPMMEEMARSIGRLLAVAGTSDVVDAMVVLGASARGDAILTSDPEDIAALVEALDSRPPPPIIRV